MVVMREWRDLNRCELARFDCGANVAEVVSSRRFQNGRGRRGICETFCKATAPHLNSTQSSAFINCRAIGWKAPSGRSPGIRRTALVTSFRREVAYG